MNIDKLWLHATTLMKLIKNQLNNLPFGFTYGKHSDNSPLLKLIFPNLLRIGRNNNRALSSLVKLPKNQGELLRRHMQYFMSFETLP